MTVLNAFIEMNLPYAVSLKGRRKVLNSIKDKLKKYNLSILDISGEYPKNATLAIIFLTHDEKSALKKLQNIESLLESSFADVEFEVSYEVV